MVVQESPPLVVTSMEHGPRGHRGGRGCSRRSASPRSRLRDSRVSTQGAERTAGPGARPRVAWRGFRGRPHGSRSEAQLFVQGRADQGADPGADVHVPLRLEPIQARPQLLIEADAKDFHASRLAQDPFVAHRHR